MPMDLLCRLQSENRRLKEERDVLAKAIGEAVVKMGVVQAVPMTGPELIHMLQSAAEITPCTFPDCMSARAVRAAGEEGEKLRRENVAMLSALQKISKGDTGEWYDTRADKYRYCQNCQDKEYEADETIKLATGGNDATPPA